MPEEQSKPLLARASLGLALAMWIEESPGRGMDLEKLLTETCGLFHPGGPSELPWPEPEPGSAKGDAAALKLALEAADKKLQFAGRREGPAPLPARSAPASRPGNTAILDAHGRWRRGQSHS